MATKTLTITEDAYERLMNVKGKNESFSDVITKHFPKYSLLDLVGIFPSEEVLKLRERINENRSRSRERVSQIAKRLR